MAANPFSSPGLWSPAMTTATARGKPASSPPPSAQRIQAQAQRQAYHRRKTRAKDKSKALRQKEAAHVEALPFQHPHAAGVAGGVGRAQDDGVVAQGATHSRRPALHLYRLLGQRS